MAVEPGSRIGPYEVVGPLGEGGMGVVMRGRDPRLQRDVALKVLPDHLSGDPDRLFRFQREAQILASLNHPHIAQVFGLEQADGSTCIVMELVEGDTLADRLAGGPMPVDEVRAVAGQLADALAAAHERGIVHRDLKPANIKVSPAGVVKVLDFGLAKALGLGSTDADVTTLQTAVTRSMPGMILGTPAYMSPEQARGREVDARTDIWAFGCVLYEMLTGRQAFAGETATDVIAQLLTSAPDLEKLPAGTPPALSALLSATLQKNPAQRLQHIGDARLFLDPAFAAVAVRPGVTPAPTPVRRGPWIAAMAAVALAAAAIPLVWFYSRPPQPRAAVMQFELSLPGVIANGGSIAPDGHAVAFIGVSTAGTRILHVRPIDSDAAQPLAGTENAAAFMWSSDSQELAFVSDGKLRKVGASGGTVQALTDVAGQYRGAAWSRSGVILLARSGDNVIVRMADSGGPVTPVTRLDAARKEVLHALPVFLPDDNRFLYVAAAADPEDSGVFLTALDATTPATRAVAVQPQRFNWMAYDAASGHLLIQNNGRILAYRMDENGQAAAGEPAVLAENIDGTFSIARDGVLMYHKAGAVVGRQLTWFDRSGKELGTVGQPAEYGGVELSPSGDRAAVDITTAGNRDVWVMDLARAVVSRLTFEESSDWSAVWSPDGRQIAYASALPSATRLYVKPASGVGARSAIESDDGTAIPITWQADGQRIIFARPKPSGRGFDTWLQPVAGGRPSIFLDTPFDKLTVRLSPDNRYIAYSSDESGQYQIFVETFPDPAGGRWQITSDGGTEPKWRRDGRELYYLGFDGRLMGVDVTGGSGFTAGRPTALFQTPLFVNRAQPSRERRYDVAPDGRFLFVAPTAAPAVTPFTVVVNWTAGLKE